MQIHLIPFGLLREKLGTASYTVEVEEGASIRQVLEQVFAEQDLAIPAGWEKWLRVAVEDEYVALSSTVRAGLEIALIPPVSGGSHGSPPLDVQVGLTQDPLENMQAMVCTKGGSLVCFDGIVRADPVYGGIKEIFYEAHASMATKKMERLARDALAIEGVLRVHMFHRVGVVAVGEAAIRVWIESLHRSEGFRALTELMDRFKEVVPIFKKEIGSTGESRWVGLDEVSQQMQSQRNQKHD